MNENKVVVNVSEPEGLSNFLFLNDMVVIPIEYLLHLKGEVQLEAEYVASIEARYLKNRFVN